MRRPVGPASCGILPQGTEAFRDNTMAAILSDNFLRYLRLALVLCCGCAALGLAGRAASAVETYQVTVPLADRSEAAQSAAFQMALKVVLIRVTGHLGADQDPTLAALIGNARRYVQQYRAAPDKQLWVAFDGPALERWLTQNNLPVWGQERPPIFVWLTEQTGPQAGTAVTSTDGSELKHAIDAEADTRGIGLIWPSAADLQKNNLDYAGINNTSPAALLEIGRRSGGEAALIGRASNASASAIVHWTFLFPDRSGDFTGALEGVDRAADTYASLFAASGGIVPVDIEVSGINDLKDYAGVQAYLESLAFVSHVGVQSLSADTARFHLMTRGGAESLQHALALHGRLQAVGAGDGGILRFQLRR
jgi:hypothetical protein